MALRLLNRFRSGSLVSIYRQFRLPQSMNSHQASLRELPWAQFDVRCCSDVAPTLKEEPFSEEKPSAKGDSKNDRSYINGARVSVKSSLSEAELAKFSAIAETWWDAEGPFKPLHALNPARIAFIRSALCEHFRRDPDSPRPFEGLKFVDVGCGGGILSEPLARMGALVTGVDAVEKNVKIARLHAELDPVTSTIEYCCTTAEKLVEEQRQFDAVIALEVIEHVADPAEFCKSLATLTVPSGATLISTINRSMRAYATAIFAAEYLLGWLPKGTHEWSRFLTPEELVLILHHASITVSSTYPFSLPYPDPYLGVSTVRVESKIPGPGLDLF
ncbi:Hexaprenyldihydroxybenzoate methyltransferase, mitochondrial [Dionaea muscipula]